MHILASQKGSKKLFHAAWFPWFAFLSCASPFLVIFLLLTSSSNRLPPAFLYMQIYISPLCHISSVHCRLLPCSAEIFGKLQVVLCRPPCLQIPAYAERSCCLFASCPEEVQPYLFSNNTQAISRLTMCALLISLIMCFPETDFIPFLLRGLQPLNPFACWHKSCLYTFCYLPQQPFGPVLSAIPLQSLLYLPLKSSHLLPAKLFNLEIMLTVCVINKSSFVQCFGI